MSHSPEFKAAAKRVALTDSQFRGPVLLAEMSLLEDRAEQRQLMEDFWSVCESWGDMLDQALHEMEQLAGEGGRLGSPLPIKLDEFVVYRATGGDTPDGGSWTTDFAVAEMFARMICGLRAKLILGYYSETPMIWQATVRRDDVLAYFTERKESEVVLPHGAAIGVELCAELVPVEKT